VLLVDVSLSHNSHDYDIDCSVVKSKWLLHALNFWHGIG